MLAKVPRVTNSSVLVGFDTNDDAGVYQLAPDLAIVQTVDFFTPIVDDPYTFGAIAAANSLSDVWAMGGRPISALSILAYPGKGDLEDLEQILKGGSEKLREADCVLLGGHSINDEEVKFGYAVTGTIHPSRVKPNSGAKPGDALLLTKSIGTGVITTALKRGLAAPEHLQAAVESMLTLNRGAAEAMAAFEVHGCTDVTGFGLVGHAREMALASGVTLEIHSRHVGLLPGAYDYAARGAIPGGLKNNREFASCAVQASADIPAPLIDLLYDPQTSGGLLISLPEEQAADLESSYPGIRRIGTVEPAGKTAIKLI